MRQQSRTRAALPPLREALRTLKEPLTLEIDDYHLATNRDNDLAILDLIGPKLRRIIVARRVTLLDDPLAARRVPTIRIGVDSLALNNAEARSYAAQFGERPAAHVDTAIQLAHGWPLAIRAALDPAAGAVAVPGTTDPFRVLDPVSALNRFAQVHLEALEATPARALLGASLVDIIDDSQIADLTGATLDEARASIHLLQELGLLAGAPSGCTNEFTCHPAVRGGLQSRAISELTPETRAALLRGRADRLAAAAPFTAMSLYLAAGAHLDAETELANHFTTITDEFETCLSVHSEVSRAILESHCATRKVRVSR